MQLIAANNNIHIKHIFNASANPPLLPVISYDVFKKLDDESQEPATRYPCLCNDFVCSRFEMFDKDKLMLYEHKFRQARRGKGEDPWRHDHKETIGNATFLVCRSQAAAAEKYSSLVAQNQTEFEAKIAPAPDEIKWETMAVSSRKKSFFKFFSLVFLVGTFVGYLVLSSYLNTVISNYQ